MDLVDKTSKFAGSHRRDACTWFRYRVHIAVRRDAGHRGWMRVIISQNASLDGENISQESLSIIKRVTAS